MQLNQKLEKKNNFYHSKNFLINENFYYVKLPK